MQFRHPLARVRGLGSAKSGTHHWWMQRVTSVALVPLAVWFIYSFLQTATGSGVDIASWLQNPCNALLILAFLAASAYHSQLGIQVVVEDYVHCHKAKCAVLLFNTLGTWFAFLVAVMAVAKLHFA